MGIDLILVGKTDSAEIAALMADYSKRISRYARFSVVFLPDVRNAGKLPPGFPPRTAPPAIRPVYKNL